MIRQSLQTNPVKTISWKIDHLIDWARGGREFLLDGQEKTNGFSQFAYSFDSAITSDDGIYAVIYKKYGTKGLLLKNGSPLREINRSYYHADIYEYPVAFAKLNNVTILIHCPDEYCRIEFEEVDTGKKLTNHIERKPSDFFHSRFEVSPDNKTLLSKGWVWQPFDFIEVYDIEKCIGNPLLLDKSKFYPDVASEICAASFITSELVLIGSTRDTEPNNIESSKKMMDGQIALWNIKTNDIIDIVTPNFIVGIHLIAINEKYAWDLYDYPKIINYRTGEIETGLKDIFTGRDTTSFASGDQLPKISYNRLTKQVAISADDKIEILTM